MMFADIQSQMHVILIFTAAILAILNPFGNLPQFLSMTEGLQAHTRKKLFMIIVLTAFIIVVVFVVSGPYIMEYVFKIHIADLRIAGGLVLVIMGVKNLLFPLSNKYASNNPDETEEEILRKSILPMAFPMLVGPGTLSTVIILSSDQGMLITLIAALLSFLFILLLFLLAPFIERMTGKLILHVIARITQVFIVAMGVRMIITGIYETLNLPIT